MHPKITLNREFPRVSYKWPLPALMETPPVFELAPFTFLCGLAGSHVEHIVWEIAREAVKLDNVHGLIRQEYVIHDTVRREKLKPGTRSTDFTPCDLDGHASLMQHSRFPDGSLVALTWPEARLHPAEVVELGWQLVRLHREHGHRFVIATHSGELCSAVQYIAEHETGKTTEELLRYYLVEETDTAGIYCISCDNVCSLVFRSFNKAFDLEDQYADLEPRAVYLR